MTAVVIGQASAIVIRSGVSAVVIASPSSPVQIVNRSPSVTIPTGSPGPKGDAGPSGSSGGSWTAPNLTGATIGGHRVVTIDPITGGAIYADCTNPDHAGRPIGITTAAIQPGDDVTATVSGNVSEPSWSWTPGTELFVGPSGSLVPYLSLPSIRAFDRRVAIPRTATDIVVDLITPVSIAA